MPGGTTHSALTRAAIQLQNFDTGDNTGLIREYCSWPDVYFSSRWKELEPYMFFLDGIQFHYPPDTSYNELYRYWNRNEKGLFRSRPFVNENFRHVTAGFSFYIEHAVRHFKQGETEEGKKFLGCLLHMLEDSTFGLHALEGPGGTDAFALDRIMDSPRPITDIVVSLKWRDDFPPLKYEPHSLGNTPGEMVMKLYAAYCKATADSRKCCFRFVMDTLENRMENIFQTETRMYGNAVRLCADAIYTIYQLAEGKIIPSPDGCRLDELEPCEFPVGGFGSYRFRSFVRDSAIDRNGNPIPLELDCGKFEHGISFGTHWEGNLRYRIEPGIFREFTGKIGLHTAFPVDGEVNLAVFNNGSPVEKIRLNESCRSTDIRILQPENDFCFSFDSTPRCGVLVIADPVLR